MVILIESYGEELPVTDVRWRDEGEEIIELLYRLQTDHNGSLPESEALELGPWVADAAKRAEQLSWLAVTGASPILKVTYGGRKALDAALAARYDLQQQHWFGGSIIPVDIEYGGRIVLPQSYEPYKELQVGAMEEGILTQEDIDRVARSQRKEPEKPEEFRMINEEIFPNTHAFSAALQYEEDHPLGGGLLDPAGHEGPYQVTATLTRRGSPDVPYLYVTDAYRMEGDSHLYLLEKHLDNGTKGIPTIVHESREGEKTEFTLLPNRQGRLGKIRTILRAENADDARRKAYHLLNPFLCDLSYRYDVPVQVLQTNVVELATLTVGGMKQDDFPEKEFDPEEFMGFGIDYRGALPHYEFFTRLYREGVNSSSVEYGFLCFFRIAEGIMKLRRKTITEQEGRKVSFDDVVLEWEVIEGEEAEVFPPELQGRSLWAACKKLYEQRDRIAHAFLNREDPVSGYEDIMADRLEGEEQAATRRAQARYIARRMMESEYWASSET